MFVPIFEYFLLSIGLLLNNYPMKPLRPLPQKLAFHILQKDLGKAIAYLAFIQSCIDQKKGFPLSF